MRSARLPRDKDPEPYLKALVRARPVMAFLILFSFCASSLFGLLSTTPRTVLLATGAMVPVRIPLMGEAWVRDSVPRRLSERLCAVATWPLRFAMCSLIETSLGQFICVAVLLAHIGTVLENWFTSRRLVRLVATAFCIRLVWTLLVLLTLFRRPGLYYMRPSLAWLCVTLYVVHEGIFRWRSRTSPHSARFYRNPAVQEPHDEAPLTDASMNTEAETEAADALAAIPEPLSGARRTRAAPAAALADLAAPAEPTTSPREAPPLTADTTTEAAPAVAEDGAAPPTAEDAMAPDAARRQAAAQRVATTACLGLHDTNVGAWQVTDATWGFSQLRLFGKIPLGAETLYFFLVLPLVIRMDFWMEILPVVITSTLALNFL